MREMKSSLPLLVSLLLLSCFALYELPRCTGKPGIPTEMNASGNKGLGKLLEEASMEDRMVILTLLQSADNSSTVNLFLESFRLGYGTARFLNHMIILVPDPQTFRFCKSLHPYCYDLSAAERSKPFVRSHRFAVEWMRNELFQEVLELGYNFFYTDVDVLWFRNPFDHLDIFDTMAIAQRYVPGSPSAAKFPDGGLFYMKSHDKLIDFLTTWKIVRVLYPDADAQSALDMTLQDIHGFRSNLGMVVKYLDMADFGDFCKGNADLARVCTVRANCGETNESKIRDLKLLMNGWRNFTTSRIRT